MSGSSRDPLRVATLVQVSRADTACGHADPSQTANQMVFGHGAESLRDFFRVPEIPRKSAPSATKLARVVATWAKLQLL